MQPSRTSCAGSQGKRTPERTRTRASRSVGSPARSDVSGRLSSLVQSHKNNRESFAFSPFNNRKSILNDDTHIEAPRRASWWKRLDDNSRVVAEVFDNNEVADANNVIEEYAEVLSPEKKNYTLDLAESSDNESVNSIVLHQRQLFRQKHPKEKFDEIIELRETAANNDLNDMSIQIKNRNLFAMDTKRSRPAFPKALLEMSLNKTANISKELAAVQEKRQEKKTLFGYRPSAKRKNLFADFIVTESEDEVPEIEPKIFAFPKKTKLRASSCSRASSVTTDVEMDDWKMLPSSTMVEQLDDNDGDKDNVVIETEEIHLHYDEEAEMNQEADEPTLIEKQPKLKQTSKINQSKHAPESKQNKINNKYEDENDRTQEPSLKHQEIENELKCDGNKDKESMTKNEANESKLTDNLKKHKIPINEKKEVDTNISNPNNNQSVNEMDGNNQCEQNDQLEKEQNESRKKMEDKIDNTQETNLSKQNEIEHREPQIQSKDESDTPNASNSSKQEKIENSEPQIESEGESDTADESNLSKQEETEQNESHIESEDEIHNDKTQKSDLSEQEEVNKSDEEEHVEESESENQENESILTKDQESEQEQDEAEDNGSDQQDTDQDANETDDADTDNQGMVVEDSDHNNSSESETNVTQESDTENQEPVEPTPNITHDTTGRNRHSHTANSVEAVLKHTLTASTSFTGKARNTSIRKTKSMLNNLHIKQSLAPARGSTSFNDGTKNSTDEGSGWDSHRTTRKTIRQTMGKDFSPRKSLRALVMEKSAKRYTAVNNLNDDIPQANSTEIQDIIEDEIEDTGIKKTNHELSKKPKKATVEIHAILQEIKRKNMETRLRIEEEFKNSLKPTDKVDSYFKIPNKPAFRNSKLNSKSQQKQPKVKPIRSKLIPLEHLPADFIEDLKYKPPKRRRPNAAWATDRLYKYLESKLQPKYEYKAKVRAERLVDNIFNFTRDLRRHKMAPEHAIEVLKREMATLNVVQTHHDFYHFFHEYMPREVRTKVVPDMLNDISLPKNGVFSDIL